MSNHNSASSVKDLDLDLRSLHTTPEVYLRWATRRDIPDIARVLHRNLEVFEFFDHFSSNRREHKEEFYGFVLNRVRMFFVKPGFRFMVAEKLELDISNKQNPQIVGFSTWEAQNNLIATAWQKEDYSFWRILERKLVDVELLHHRYVRNTIFDYAAFEGAWRLFHDDSQPGSQYPNSCLHLQYLMVEPAWQNGHGIGHRLLQWGLDIADQAALPIVLESSLAGFPFYLKRRFRVLKMVRIDIDPSRAYDMPILLYEPEGKRGTVLAQ